MARDGVGLSGLRRSAWLAACLAVWGVIGCGDDGGGPSDAGRVDAGPPPPHVGAWFRCEDEPCYLIADDGFELLRDGTANELRAMHDPGDEDAGVPFGEVGFDTWCEMPWGHYTYDGVNFALESEVPGEGTVESIFDVRRDVGTFIYDDLSHTHYWRVEGTSVGACSPDTERGLVRTTPELGSMSF